MPKLTPWLRFIEGHEGGSATDQDEPQGNSDTDERITDEEGNVDWKAAARKHEREAKALRKKVEENEAAVKRLAELEESDKSEAQKAADRAAELERERDALRVEGLRWKIAARHGLTDDDAELFLHGTDEDTLTAQAERLTQLIRPAGQQPNPNAGRTSQAEKGSVAAGAERWSQRHTK